MREGDYGAVGQYDRNDAGNAAFALDPLLA